MFWTNFPCFGSFWTKFPCFGSFWTKFPCFGPNTHMGPNSRVLDQIPIWDQIPCLGDPCLGDPCVVYPGVYAPWVPPWGVHPCHPPLAIIATLTAKQEAATRLDWQIVANGPFLHPFWSKIGKNHPFPDPSHCLGQGQTTGGVSDFMDFTRFSWILTIFDPFRTPFWTPFSGSGRPLFRSPLYMHGFC